jgi:hypothetical protein
MKSGLGVVILYSSRYEKTLPHGSHGRDGLDDGRGHDGQRDRARRCRRRAPRSRLNAPGDRYATPRDDALSIFGLVIAVVILGMTLYLIGKLAF